MRLDRRTFLGAVGGAGALLFLPTMARATRPQSSLAPYRRLTLVESDLHNHTLLSDGNGAAEGAFEMMRSAGLDVAALTDHATAQRLAGEAGALSCPSTCGALAGITEGSWRALGSLADAADEPGAFVAMRGFEWTTLAMGHMNVWFSDSWTDGLSTRGFGSAREAELAAYEIDGATPLPAADLAEALRPLLYTAPSAATTEVFYEWLASTSPTSGGGPLALAGFNHPNLYGNFDDFRFDPRVVDRIVSLEMFSFGKDDYLYQGVDEQRPNPLSHCLDAGWRVGLLGVSDEHGTTYGGPKGRGGLWVSDLSRAGVRDALAGRRFFAAAEPGVQLSATANGVPMGSRLAHRSGLITIDLDLAVSGMDGRELRVQVLRTGAPMPAIVDAIDVVTRSSGSRHRVRIDHDIADGRWIVLRVTDPSQPADQRAAGDYASAGRALAYASPFFLDPDA